MSNVFNDQAVFMLASGQTVGKYNPEQLYLYTELIKEESNEFFDSTEFTNTLKELADILVVTLGALQSTGVDPEEIWNEVVKSNMSKINPETGLVNRREDGKILKGESYIAPDFSKFAR